ncbi:MAG: hypothetical protein ABSB74_06575 [Tepidisphaeraceae bacterium]
MVQVRRFLLALNRAGTEAKRNRVERKWPELYGARAIFIGHEIRRHELEARLLCEAVELIAGKMNIPAGVVTAYAETFFDVLVCRQALDWLLEHAIRAHSFAKPPKENECWRYMALAGGPVILDLLIGDHLGRPDPEYPDRHELAERVRFRVRDYASLVQTGQPADPEMVKEYCRRYLDDARRRGKKLDPRIALNLKILRLAAKLPRCPELERVLPKVKRQPAGQDPKDKCNERDGNGVIALPAVQPAPLAGVSQNSNPAKSKGATSWTTDECPSSPKSNLRMPNQVVVGV